MLHVCTRLSVISRLFVSLSVSVLSFVSCNICVVAKNGHGSVTRCRYLRRYGFSFFVGFCTRKPSYRWQNPRDVKVCQNCSNSTCLQRCRWQYWPIFIRLAVAASEICEIPRNSVKIQTYGVQSHPRSSILVSMESPYVTILVINSNCSRICNRFRDIHG